MIDLSCNFRTSFLPAALAVLISLLPSLAFGQGRTETIVMTGQAAPDGNGTFSFWSAPFSTIPARWRFLAFSPAPAAEQPTIAAFFEVAGEPSPRSPARVRPHPMPTGLFQVWIYVPHANDSGTVRFSVRSPEPAAGHR